MAPWEDTLVEAEVLSWASDGRTGFVGSWDDALWWWTTTDDVQQLSLSPRDVRSAAATTEGLWVVLDDELHLYDSVLAPADWPSLNGPITSMHPDGPRLWIRAGGLFVREEGVITELRLDGAAITSEAVTGARLGGAAVAWVIQEDVLVALDSAGVVLEGFTPGARIDGVAADRTGAVWCTSEGWLFVREGTDDWAQVQLDGPAWRLLAHPTGEGVWVESDGQWFFVGPDERVIVQADRMGPDTALYPDSLGRIGLVDADGLHRLTIRRPVEVLGPPEGTWIEWSTEVGVLPTAADEVTGLTLSLWDADNTEVPLELDDQGTAVLDPLGLRFGGWTLRANATYEGLPDGTGELNVNLSAAGGATWSEHILPIYEADCSVCHAGGTETVLDSPEAWEASIGLILDKVITGEMPLGGTPLTDEEIALIQAWEAGGFQQ